ISPEAGRRSMHGDTDHSEVKASEDRTSVRTALYCQRLAARRRSFVANICTFETMRSATSLPSQQLLCLQWRRRRKSADLRYPNCRAVSLTRSIPVKFCEVFEGVVLW